MFKKISEIDVSEIKENEVFFVDTNVLLAIHFDLSSWRDAKKSIYANFVLSLLNNGNKLCVSMLNLQELYNLVERLEYEQYRLTYPNISRKDYRKIETERTRIKTDLQSKHAEISEYYSLVPCLITGEYVKNFVDNYSSHLYEPIDFLVVRHNSNKCVNFITDDSDFKYDSNIMVFSYN